MYLFYTTMQQEAISQARTDARRARSKAEYLSLTIKNLEEKIDQMALRCQAMWELLRDTTGLTDAEIVEKICDVDLRDGVLDGKITKTGQPCPGCGRTINAKHNHCLYCGEPAQSEEIF
jgi:hypothetical protein